MLMPVAIDSSENNRSHNSSLGVDEPSASAHFRSRWLLRSINAADEGGSGRNQIIQMKIRSEIIYRFVFIEAS